MRKQCSKCEGTGYVTFKHVQGGKCFRCNGRGYFNQTAAEAAQEAAEAARAAAYESQREQDPVYEFGIGDQARGIDGALYRITALEYGQYEARNEESGKILRIGVDSEFLQPCSR